MKTIILWIMSYLILSSVVYSDIPQIIKVGISQNKPMAYYEKERFSGISVELLDHIAQKENWNIRYVLLNWNDCIEKLQNGEIDLIVDMAYSEERCEEFDFSKKPIIHNWGFLYVHEGSNFNDLSELNGKKIAAMEDCIYEKKLKELFHNHSINAEIIHVNSYEDVLKSIGRNADFGVVNRFYGVYHEKYYKIDRTHVALGPIELYFVVQKDNNKELINALSDHLIKFLDDNRSEYHKIINRHLSEYKIKLPMIGKLGILAFLFLILLLIGLNYYLKKQIDVKNRLLKYESRNFNKMISALNKERTLLNKIIKTSPMGIIIFDKRSVIYANEIAKNTFGISEDEFDDKSIITQKIPFFNNEMILSKFIDNESPVHDYKFSYINDDNKVIMLSLSGTIIKKGENNADFIIIAEDISELESVKKEKTTLKEQVRHLQKSKEFNRLTSSITHDFNNLLSIIQVNLELIRSQKLSRKNLLDYIDKIHITTQKAINLTRQFLIFNRRKPIKKELYDLNTIIKEFSKLIEKLIGDKHKIKLDIGSPLPFVKGDIGNIEQILLNLIVNAKDSMASGGNITIKTELIFGVSEKEKEFIKLSVIDTGCGIGKEIINSIFDPFFSTKKLGKGTGLGLAVVKDIVEQLNGYINVISSDKGCTFEIFFPAFYDETKRTIQIRKKDMSLKNTYKILIVEDERLLLDSLIKYFKRLNPETYEAISGNSAQELFEKIKFDLVITDLILPDIKGSELIEYFQKKEKNIKIIITSGYSDINVNEIIGSKKNIRFIQKPYTFNELLDSTIELLEGKKSQRKGGKGEK